MQRSEDGDLDVRRVLREFGRDLREARQRAGLSQVQLAVRLGLNQSHVSRVEQGLRNLSLAAMTAFARAVGYDLIVSFRPARRPPQK